ncbi:MAG: ABC transporter permease [Bacteroidales bacterium]|nr:ABC transporter permease [Bacteroidales bacterium]
MIKNHFIVAIRNLIKQKGYFIINLLGLTIGLTSCLLITFYVIDELSYDRYHEKAERIYRIGYDFERPNGDKVAQIPTEYMLKESFESYFNQIETFVRIGYPSTYYVKYEDKKFYESKISLVDKDFFDVFTYEWIAGNPKGALDEPFTIVITETVAKKFFGDENPINKTLHIMTDVGEAPSRITGVIKDMPTNSHFHLSIMLSMGSAPNVLTHLQLNVWGNMSVYNYILMPENTSIESIQKKGKDFTRQMRGDEGTFNPDLLIQPLLDIHLHSNARFEIEPNGNYRNVMIFSIIAIFILLIASINYMNLATARSEKRSLEVGMRKVLGAKKMSLVFQFLGEAIIMTFLSLILSLALADILMPAFNTIAGKEINIVWMNNLWIILLTFVIAIVIGIFSGSYPAFFLSSVKPLNALKKKSKNSSSSSILRKVLVIFQFSISIILIVCTLIVFLQWSYMKNKPLGIDPSNIVLMRHPGTEKYETFKEELLKNPNIINISASLKRPPYQLSFNLSYTAEGIEYDGQKSIKLVTVEYDYFETLENKIVEGRSFDRNMSVDENSTFILNEAAIKEFGWDDPIGKMFETSKIDFTTGEWVPRKGQVIGVAEDFHFESVRSKIVPVVYFINHDMVYWMIIKINSSNTSETLEYIKEKWDDMNVEINYAPSFYNDDLDKLYRAEERFFQLFVIFSGLAIVIACLGIFGLASFTAEQRTKEIGIRKVMGASVITIIRLINREFLMLVLISNIISWPVAWYFMRNWLNNFTYKIDLTIWPFIISGLIAIIIALLSVTYKSLKASSTNPIEALRYE